MRHIFPFVFLGLLAAGCGGAESPGTGEGGTAPDAGAGGAGGVGGAPPAGPGLAGTLKDDADQPMGNSVVLACMATVCFFGDTAPDGSFFFPLDPTTEIALKTIADLTITPRRAAALCPVRIADAALVDVGALHVPSLPNGALLGPAARDPQTLFAGDGLELTLRRADLTAQIGDTLVDVAARRVPPPQACPFLAPGGEQLVAVYALHPFAAVSASPIAVRAPSDLPAGTPVRFRTVSELDGAFSEPISGEADGALVATAPGTGITGLTWLVISRE